MNIYKHIIPVIKKSLITP